MFFEQKTDYMALPPQVVGAAVSSGGNIISDVANSISVATQNRKSREYSDKVRAEDRKWALEDWTRQTNWNSPANQRKLLEEADLSPALMYGGGASSGGQASEVRSTNTQRPEFTPSRFEGVNGVTSFLSQMYDLEAKSLGIKNLEDQNTKLREEAAYIAAQRENTLADTLGRRFDLDFKSEFRETSASYLSEQVRNLKANTEMVLDENTRKELAQIKSFELQAKELLQKTAQTANTEAQTRQINSAIELMKKDSRLKDLEIALRQEGLNPNDPTWMRVLTMYVKSLIQGGSIMGAVNKVSGQLPDFRKSSWKDLVDPKGTARRQIDEYFKTHNNDGTPKRK